MIKRPGVLLAALFAEEDGKQIGTFFNMKKKDAISGKPQQYIYQFHTIRLGILVPFAGVLRPVRHRVRYTMFFPRCSRHQGGDFA